MRSPQFHLHGEMEEKHWWFLGRRRIVRELIRCAVSIPPGDVVADIGCGTGGNTASLASDFSCVGFDHSFEAIRLARKRFPNVSFICGDIREEITRIRDRVSLFLLMDVLEHVPDDFLFLSEILGLAKPGSHLILTVPADPALWSEHDVSFGHYRRYACDRFSRLWANLPVTTRLLSYYNCRLYPVVRVIRAFNRLQGRTSGKAGTDFKMPIKPLNDILESIFAGEAKALMDLLQGKRSRGFPYGVSLMALLRRESGEVHPRRKPEGVEPDFHNPCGPSSPS